jgi:hypothetical protein
MDNKVITELQNVIRDIRTEVDEMEEFWGCSDDRWVNSREGQEYIKKCKELDSILSDLDTAYSDLETLYE